MKWSKSWQISTSNSKGAKKKFQVKVNQLKLQGFDHSQLLNLIEDEMIMRKISNTIIMVEVKWKCPKHYVFLMVPFSGRRSKCQTYYSSQIFLRKIDHYENLIQWGDEFESICSLFSNKESIFSPSHLTFKLLYVSFFFMCRVCVCVHLRLYWVIINFFFLMDKNKINTGS